MPRNKIIPYNPKLKELARTLRKNPTHAEKVLWNAIRRKELGYEFHRQMPILNYIVDFYCHELMLAIEIDGVSHDSDEAKISDQMRQQEIEKYWVRFLGFRDEEVNENSDEVFENIKRWIEDNG